VLKKLSILAVSVVAIVLVAAMVLFYPRSKEVPRVLVVPTPPDLPAKTVGIKRVERHSVVRGGIHSLADLMKALQDPAVAAHYSGFDVSKAHIIVLDHDLWAFVSYRVEKGIYWTAAPQKIHAGELVITDGTSYIRASCGNLIAYAPQSPVAPEEPLDIGQLEALPPPEAEAMLLPEVESSSSPAALPTVAEIPPGTFTPPVPPGGCCDLFPPPIIIIGGSPPPPVAVTPEPETFALLILGMLFLMILAWLKHE